MIIPPSASHLRSILNLTRFLWIAAKVQVIDFLHLEDKQTKKW